jgi:hypothetical protein
MNSTTSSARGEIPQLIPRWLRLPAASAYSGISRAKLYDHLIAGRIRAAFVQESANTRGTRLFDRLSIDEFLLSSIGKGPAVRVGREVRAGDPRPMTAA